MSIPLSFFSLLGNWSGTSHLFLPGVPVRVSEVTASLSRVIGGQFLQLAYTWSDEDQPQEGLLLLGATQTLFADSWHMGDRLMVCKPWSESEPEFCVFGNYRVAGHPDWGWRTVIEPGDGALRVAMFNVPPPGEGEEALGFECILARE